MLPTHVRKARHDDRDELTGLLAGLPFPMATEELMAVGVRLLLPPRILDQLGRLPRTCGSTPPPRCATTW